MARESCIQAYTAYGIFDFIFFSIFRINNSRRVYIDLLYSAQYQCGYFKAYQPVDTVRDVQNTFDKNRFSFAFVSILYLYHNFISLTVEICVLNCANLVAYLEIFNLHICFLDLLLCTGGHVLYDLPCLLTEQIRSAYFKLLKRVFTVQLKFRR